MDDKRNDEREPADPAAAHYILSISIELYAVPDHPDAPPPFVVADAVEATAPLVSLPAIAPALTKAAAEIAGRMIQNRRGSIIAAIDGRAYP